MTDAIGPDIAVVIPARDEAADIARSLRALRRQDVDPARVEVVVVDGGSTDGTPDVARRELAGAGFARAEVVANPAGGTPSNLNRGLAATSAEIVCRVDARSIVPPGYLRRCAEVLGERAEVVVVGGAQRAVARDGSALGAGIARALNNRWSMGLSRYRRGAGSGATDTVYLGSFRRRDLEAVGGWDERFSTNQDFDLNRRLGASGTVWFESDLVVGYLPRASLGELARQYHRFGRWKAVYWRERGERPRPRQLVALAAPVLGLGVLASAMAAWRPVRRAAPVALLVGAAAFEDRGSQGPPGGVRARVASLAATACVTGGWVVGAWTGLLVRGRRPS